MLAYSVDIYLREIYRYIFKQITRYLVLWFRYKELHMHKLLLPWLRETRQKCIYFNDSFCSNWKFPVIEKTTYGLCCDCFL